MEKNTFETPTAPIANAFLIDSNRNFNYFFKIKKRSFFCYKAYMEIKQDENNYKVSRHKNENILCVSKNKSVDDIVNIMKTIGIKNNAIFLCKVCSDQKTMSKKRFFNLKSLISFIFKTDQILKDIKYIN